MLVASPGIDSGAAAPPRPGINSPTRNQPGRAAELELDLATPLPDLLGVVLDAGTVTLCTQCAARRGITADDVLPGVRIAGAASFVEAVMRPRTQALVY